MFKLANFISEAKWAEVVFRILLESLYHCRWSWGCQAFSDYQMQQMTSNFIDQFGFNDEKFADQDDIGK